MKKTIKQITILFAFSVASTAFAQNDSDTYQAPEFNLRERSLDHVEVRSGNWDSSMRFRVHEDPMRDRGIASDEEYSSDNQISRDPSSYEPLELNFETDVQKWRWQDIEHQP